LNAQACKEFTAVCASRQGFRPEQRYPALELLTALAVRLAKLTTGL